MDKINELIWNDMMEKCINENVFVYHEMPSIQGGYLADMGDWVRLDIQPTKLWEKAADVKRKALGFAPLFDVSGNYDDEGWYDFYLSVTRNGVDALLFDCQYTAEDDMTLYEIELADDQKKWLYDRVVSLIGAETWNDEWDLIDAQRTQKEMLGKAR